MNKDRVQQGIETQTKTDRMYVQPKVVTSYRPTIGVVSCFGFQCKNKFVQVVRAADEDAPILERILEIVGRRN